MNICESQSAVYILLLTIIKLSTKENWNISQCVCVCVCPPRHKQSFDCFGYHCRLFSLTSFQNSFLSLSFSVSVIKVSRVHVGGGDGDCCCCCNANNYFSFWLFYQTHTLTRCTRRRDKCCCCDLSQFWAEILPWIRISVWLPNRNEIKWWRQRRCLLLLFASLLVSLTALDSIRRIYFV